MILWLAFVRTRPTKFRFLSCFCGGGGGGRGRGGQRGEMGVYVSQNNVDNLRSLD